jgi:transposase InsO family protein
LSDRGPEFESAIIRELCRLIHVDKIRTTAYHAAGNGMIERFHRTLNAMIAKVVAENQKDWPDHIPVALAAYRATVHDATGFTPNKLVFGKENRLPVDLIYGPHSDHGVGEPRLSEFRQLVGRQTTRRL